MFPKFRSLGAYCGSHSLIHLGSQITALPAGRAHKGWGIRGCGQGEGNTVTIPRSWSDSGSRWHPELRKTVSSEAVEKHLVAIQAQTHGGWNETDQ